MMATFIYCDDDRLLLLNLGQLYDTILGGK